MKNVQLTDEFKQQVQQQLELEKHYQDLWDQQHLFEVEPDNRKKYFATVPYSYANGLLHAGHLFTISKQEFSCGFHRLLNENVLQTAAFHCTGQPICGAAIKLKNEINKFGWPPKQELLDEEKEAQNQQPKQKKQSDDIKVPTNEHKSAKTKLTEKTSSQHQFEILREFGIKDEEIPSFVDPYKWVRTFPVEAYKDLKHFGLRFDSRRVFTTTEANPVYDKFIQWQFNRLYKLGKISYGTRNCIYSPIDKQVCMDHDRSTGEGLGVQEYCAIKCQIVQQDQQKYAQIPELIQNLLKQNNTVYMPCATLRAETMIGQTNIWVQPEFQYQIVKVDESVYYICLPHASEQMSYQQINNKKDMGEIEIIGEIKVKAPMVDDLIPVLPLLTISAEKGTGCVTSVPSDAPDDYMALKDLKNNVKNIRTKYNISEELVSQLNHRDIIEVQGEGKSIAAAMCEKQKVKDQHDTSKLKEIKQFCYSKGFYDGVMIVGPYKGQKVEQCKPLCKQYLIDQNQAFVFAEPEGEIISRSGCKCVAAKTSQYFLNYGDEEWKKQTHEALKLVNTYSEEVRNQFNAIIDWLQMWPLSRTFGLGSKLPCDQKFIIESLSDSTIYNSFYTLADKLQQGDIYGEHCPFEISELDNDFFDYVYDIMDQTQKQSYLSKYDNQPTKKQLLQDLLKEFQYFYPVDLRVSGKDLVGNHLTFYIFTHCAIWNDKPQYYPRGIRVNGHLMLNGMKMSKSTGNFLTARQCIDSFSSDGIRLAMAEAGDSRDDANIEISRTITLFNQLMQIKQMIAQNAKYTKAQEQISRQTKIFLGQIYQSAVQIYKSLNKCIFKDAIIQLMKTLPDYRNAYLTACKETEQEPDMNAFKIFNELYTQYLSVFCPHTAEDINYKILNNKISIMKQYINIDELEAQCNLYAKDLMIYNYVNKCIIRINNKRLDDKSFAKKRKLEYKQPTKAYLYVAHKYDDYKIQIIDKAKEVYIRNDNQFVKESTGELIKYSQTLNIDNKQKKLATKFITELIQIAAIDGENAFLTKLPFDEKEVYTEYKFMICKSAEIKELECHYVGEPPIEESKVSSAEPSRPLVFFE